MADFDTKKYNKMEKSLQIINENFISLPPTDIEAHNEIISQAVDEMIRLLKEDPLFKKLYQRPYYGGSFYDGLKTNKPDEYDLDILLVVPKCISCQTKECKCVKMECSNDYPGFVSLKIEQTYQHNEDYIWNPDLKGSFRRKLVNENYLDADWTKKWIEGLVDKILGNNSSDFFNKKINITRGISKAGIVLVLKSNNAYSTIHVDFVPAFRFTEEMLPVNKFRKIPKNITNKEIFIIPKSPNASQDGKFWRVSFQQQEKEFMKNLQHLKSTIKLVKKMRDNYEQNSRICSYFIKTVALWSVETKNDQTFWRDNSLSYIFMWFLKEYKNYLGGKNIPNFWFPQHNLLDNEKYGESTRKNDYDRIVKAIKNIERNLESEPYWVAKEILSNEEYNIFLSKYEDIPENDPEQSTTECSSMSPGTIAGIAVGVAALAVVGGALASWFKKSDNNQPDRRNRNT